MNLIDYEEKYTKYKQKYLELKHINKSETVNKIKESETVNKIKESKTENKIEESETENKIKKSEISEQLIGGAIKGKQIYLVRHGETDWNVKGLGQGSRNDIPLNKTGKEQAIKTGKYLGEYRQKDGKFDLVLCSPLIRTRETCELICNKIGYDISKVKYMDELKENDKGTVCIGKTESELRKDKFNDDYYKVKESIPKIKDPIERTVNYEKIIKTIEKKYSIESKENLRKRIYKIINFIKKTNKKKILIVTHGGYILYFLQYLFNIYRVQQSYSGTENCHISVLKYVNNKFNLLYGPSTEHFNLYDKK
jgi:broad specificity phosphatase PhoE